MPNQDVFENISRSSLAEEIAFKLLNLIREKKLLPGDKLPPERELATLMSVSRPSLREALRALAIMKVIEIRQGDGTYVTSLEPKQLVEHLEFVFSLDDSTFLELFEARRVVEVGLVALAAERITEEQIAELEHVLEKAVENVDNLEAFVEVDYELHELIGQVAGNAMLSRFMTSIGQISRASRMRTARLPDMRSEAVADHQKIVRALKARDPRAAQQAMLDHLDGIERRLRAIAAAEDADTGDSTS